MSQTVQRELLNAHAISARSLQRLLSLTTMVPKPLSTNIWVFNIEEGVSIGSVKTKGHWCLPGRTRPPGNTAKGTVMRGTTSAV